MGYFQVRYDSRVVNYDRRGFIRLATGFVIHICSYYTSVVFVINTLRRCVWVCAQLKLT